MPRRYATDCARGPRPLNFGAPMSLLRHLPNTLTCLNLVCGSVAVVMAVDGSLVWAAYLVLAAAAFDFADGFAARALKVQSAIGKELDSLADMVTFGLVPGIVLMRLMADELGEESLTAEALYSQPLLLVPLLMPVFSALRLAKFNIDTRQTEGFIGVPTPASALWVISVPLIQTGANGVAGVPQYGFLYYLLTSLILPILMVSNVPLMALKFKHLGWRGNEFKLSLIIVALVLLGIIGWLAIPATLTIYLLLSIIQNAINRKRR